MNILLEKLANIENRQHALEVEFIDYCEKNPKSNDQWTEQRLRALEDQLKTLGRPMVVKKPDTLFNPETGELEPELIPLDERVALLEDTLEDVEETISDLASQSYLREFMRDVKENFANHIQHVNNRFKTMEQLYNCIDPKYLEMGQELSQANKDMIDKQLERDRFHMNNFLKLAEEINILRKEVQNLNPGANLDA